MALVRVSGYAMATRFEIALYGDDTSRLRGGAEEALKEIERLDAQMSIYHRDSELSWINAKAGNGPVKVEPRLFQLLMKCTEISELTAGAFDITIEPLMRVWGFTSGKGRKPYAEEIESALQFTGIQHMKLNKNNSTVEFDSVGVGLDLGAIGKGYALERAAEILRDNGVNSALLHGGTSCITTIGTPPHSSAWRVAIRDAKVRDGILDTVDMKNESLSVSGVHGKSFKDGNVEIGHIIDPRTGLPIEGPRTAVVVGPSATCCDALSTALLVLGKTGPSLLAEKFPEYRGYVAN